MHSLDSDRDTPERIVLTERVFRHDPSNLKTAASHGHRLTRAGGCARLIESGSVGLKDICDHGRASRLPIPVGRVIAHANDFESMDDQGLHNVMPISGRDGAKFAFEPQEAYPPARSTASAGYENRSGSVRLISWPGSNDNDSNCSTHAPI